MATTLAKTKAFAYLRVSGQGQVSGDGFKRQATAIKQYAVKNEIAIVHTFEEKGVSGTVENMDRPAWADMMTRMHANGVKTVIVERLDRLARDLRVQEGVIVEMQRNGFELISVEEPDLMSHDAYRVAMRQIMGVFAQLDKSNLVAKLRGARMRKAAAGGKAVGSYPFGHRPGETETVALMKELRLTGLGFDRIAAELNARGIKPRRGEKWGGNTVNVILTRVQLA